jgi:hypothetical protein
MVTGEKTIAVNYFIEIVIIEKRLYSAAFNPYCSIKAKENIRNAGYRPTSQACSIQCSFENCRLYSLILYGAFVRELNASGYPLHLSPATWVNYRIPTVGL